ncbi:hypothetical protein Pcinc_033199 [Petrolisthes cinctipes]|uniref:Uncharacterized protein n=1 Tax=Petrolisthes cinctipes TaxID=88211 RepID=A0AAE1JXV5_PETCI|nr:hypothetical protein Pcinc_033199 [Petrolisthes cinctipes]
MTEEEEEEGRKEEWEEHKCIMVESVVGRVVVMVVVGVVGGVAAILLVRAEAAARNAVTNTNTTTSTTTTSDRREVPLTTHDTRHIDTNTDEDETDVRNEWSRMDVNELQLTRSDINRLQREGSLLDALLNVISRRVTAVQHQEEEGTESGSERETQDLNTIKRRSKREVHDHKHKAMTRNTLRSEEGEVAQVYRLNTNNNINNNNRRSKREAVQEYKQDANNQRSEQQHDDNDDDEYQQQQQQQRLQKSSKKRETMSESRPPPPLSARHRIRHRSRKAHHRHYEPWESSQTPSGDTVTAIQESSQTPAGDSVTAATNQQDEEGIIMRADKAGETVRKSDMLILPSISSPSTSIVDSNDDVVVVDDDATVNVISGDSVSIVNSTMQHPMEGRTVVVWKTNLTLSVLLAIPLAVVLTVLAVLSVSCCCCCCWRRRITNNNTSDTPDDTQTEEQPKLTQDWWIPFGCEACCLPDISYQIHRDANPQYKPINVHSSILLPKTTPNLSSLIKSRASTVLPPLPHSRPPLLHDLLSNLPPGASRIGFDDSRIGFHDSRRIGLHDSRIGFEDERMLLEKGDEDWCLSPADGVYDDENDDVGQVVVVGYGINRRARSLESLIL